MKTVKFIVAFGMSLTLVQLSNQTYAADTQPTNNKQYDSQEVSHRYGPKDSNQSNSSLGGKHDSGPPQEAINACSGEKNGDQVTFSTPDGHTISGICRRMDNLLFAVPKGGPPKGKRKR